MARWVAQLLAAGLAAPVATLFAYRWIVEVDVQRFVQNHGFIAGLFSISMASLNGVEAARSIARRAEVVFAAAYEHYAVTRPGAFCISAPFGDRQPAPSGPI